MYVLPYITANPISSSQLPFPRNDSPAPSTPGTNLPILLWSQIPACSTLILTLSHTCTDDDSLLGLVFDNSTQADHLLTEVTRFLLISIAGENGFASTGTLNIITITIMMTVDSIIIMRMLLI